MKAFAIDLFGGNAISEPCELVTNFGVREPAVNFIGLNTTSRFGEPAANLDRRVLPILVLDTAGSEAFLL
eukprot:5692276-Amphidinium_carterae.1